MSRVALIDAIGSRALAHPRWSALLCGSLAATGFPPLGLWPVALLGMAGLIALIAAAPGWRAAAGLGWMFGLAHFTLANNWIATAFTYQANMPAIMGWLAVPLIATYLAIYPALAAGAARAMMRRNSLPMALALAFAGCWIVAEWLRGWVFTGYPWDPFGLALLGPWDRPGIAALLPWLGTYALSGAAVLAAGTLWALLVRQRLIALGGMALVLAAAMHWPASTAERGTLSLTLVQPNLQQDEINNPALFEGQFLRTALLSRRTPANPPGTRLVLWPESGVPDYLEDGYPQRYYDQMTAEGDPRFARARIGQVIGPDSLLLTGAVNLEIRDGYAVGARNSVTVIDSDGAITGSYDKAHLVPYGEYLAMRWLLEPLGAQRLVAGAFDFWPGPGPRTLDLGPWGKAGMQICYEIIFSGEVVDQANRPDYIYNPSNDGWFGSFGPPQHLGQARMRAIEEGLPVLRSTTTGISAVIDARGVVRAAIGRNQPGRIDTMVPPAHAPTLFARLGNMLALEWSVLLLIASVVAMRLRRR